MTYAVNESSNTKHLLSHPQQKTRSWKKWETEHKWKSSRLGKEHSEFKRWLLVLSEKERDFYFFVWMNSNIHKSVWKCVEEV